MSLITTRYFRPDEDLALTAVAVTGSAEDPEYPAEYLIVENPAKPAKLTTTTGNWVLEFTAPIAPVAVGLIYQYLDAGLEVRIQANSSDSWGAPPFNQLITIPAKRRDGPSYQRWTVNPWVELSGSPSYRFWRLVVVGTNSQVVVVGRIVLPSALHDVTIFHGDTAIDQTERPPDDPGQIQHLTELGVLTVITLGGPMRGLSGIFIGSDLSAGTAPVQDAADFRALMESTEGVDKPWGVIPFETNDLWLVRNTNSGGQRSHRQGGYQMWPFDVREVSRGLPYP